MADNYSMCLLGVMDRLWFQQIILFPEPTSLLLPKILKPDHQSIAESTISQSTVLPEEEFSLPQSPISPQPQKDESDSNNEDDDDDEKETKLEKGRPARLRIERRRMTRSESSSPLTQKRSSRKLLRYMGSVTRLQKTMSCKSLLELELEEVKGFMDLGFQFNKQDLSPEMISVLPGLQRIREHKFTIDGAEEDDDDDEDDDIERGWEEEEEEKAVMRPYLSEAWLIKRPDSPLLNLRIPKVSATADMKEHIKNWARTVASVIHEQGS